LDVPWSTGGVMAATRARMSALGASVTELAPLWDVDTPADLARYRAEALSRAAASA